MISQLRELNLINIFLENSLHLEPERREYFEGDHTDAAVSVVNMTTRAPLDLFVSLGNSRFWCLDKVESTHCLQPQAEVVRAPRKEDSAAGIEDRPLVS